MILTGAAGTGKTGTMILAIRCVLHHTASSSRILVCTPSHTAADVITRRLGECGLGPSQLFRLYDASRPIETVPTAVLKYCRQSARSGTFELPPSRDLLLMRVIVCTCTDAHILYRIGLTNQQLRIRRSCYEGYLQKTCYNANLSVNVRTAVGGDVTSIHFTHLFVDEAAQATEPEILIPLSVVVDPGSTRGQAEVALVGDPRQLSPAVYSVSAATAGLERSLMERLLQRPIQCLGGGQSHMLGPDLVQMEEWLAYSFKRDGQEQLSVFLTLNYRCHPSILMMPSALFYFDKLLTVDAKREGENGASFWCEKLRWVETLSRPIKVSADNSVGSLPVEAQCRKQFDWPIHFVGVEGTDRSVTLKTGFSSSTWSNAREAEKLVDIVVTLTEKGVKSQSIGVMAPFRGQVVLVRKLLRSKRLAGVNVGTIEDFQAKESDVCLISLTRSTSSFIQDDIDRRVGVFGQPKRSNVALTRAEHLLIVVGSPTVMAGDPIWRQFLLYCIRNGLSYGDPGRSNLECNSKTRVCRLLNDEESHQKSFASFSQSHSPRTSVCLDKLVVGSLERVLRSNS